MVAGVILFDGCIGSFTLTNKIYHWNETVTNDKYVNTALMWVLGFFTPVYAGTLLIDVAILNVIEFWTGKNPVAFSGQEKLDKQVTTKDGTDRVTMGDNEITIARIDGSEAGKTIRVQYYPESSTFYISDEKGVPTKVGSISGTTLNLYAPDGKIITRSLSTQDGGLAVSQ